MKIMTSIDKQKELQQHYHEYIPPTQLNKMKIHKKRFSAHMSHPLPHIFLFVSFRFAAFTKSLIKTLQLIWTCDCKPAKLIILFSPAKTAMLLKSKALTKFILNAIRQEPETPLSHHCSLLFIGKASTAPDNLIVSSAFIKTHHIEKMQLIRVFKLVKCNFEQDS